MNQDENNQNHPVSYDFITNQNVVVNKPKDKRILIIIVLAVLTIIMVLALALASNNNIQEVTKTEQIPEKHLRLVTSNQLDEAISLYAESKEITKNEFEDFWIDYLSKKYDLTKCNLTENNSNEDSRFTKVFCPTPNSNEGGILTYEINNQTGLIVKVSDVAETASN